MENKISKSLSIIKNSLQEYSETFFACSFGKDSIVVLDLLLRTHPKIKVVCIDTSYEFPETLSFANKVVKEKSLVFEWVRPSKEEVSEIEKKYGDEQVINEQYKCCEMKIPAIKSFLNNNNYDAWITGLRRDETPFRKNMTHVEKGTVTKINPILDWTEKDVWEYINNNSLEVHPLY